MNSAFLVFNLIGGDADFECECDFGRFVHPKLDDLQEAVGLVSGISVITAAVYSWRSQWPGARWSLFRTSLNRIGAFFSKAPGDKNPV